MKRKTLISVIAVILAVIMLASLALTAIPVKAYADELDDLKKQRSELNSQVKECEKRLEALKNEEANALEKKAALDEQNRLANEELQLLAKEIAGYDRLIKEKAEEVEKAKNRETDQLNRYRARVRAMEENNGYNILALIAGSESFGELLTAMDDIGEIMQSDKDLQKQYVDARKETEEIKAQYEEEKAEYEADQTELKEEKALIEKRMDENAKYLEELAADIEKAKAEYEAAEAAEAAASATISSLIAELNRQKAEEQATAKAEAQLIIEANAAAAANGEQAPYTEEQAQQAAAVLGGGNVQSGGGLVWPVPCSTRVTSRFGNRSDPFTGAQAYHSGIDIDGFGNDGGIIVASAAGTVVTASYDGAYGNYVIIDHGDMQTLYAHMSGMAVSAGASVSQGQTIGYLGATGRATGTHCHFEVFVGGSRVDPAAYFSGISYYNC